MGAMLERDILDFLIVTLILGGGAAVLTGRAIALAWEPLWRAVLWMLLLNCAVRFIHFAIFGGTLLSVRLYLMDLVILIIAAALGHRLTRVRQMRDGYHWKIAPRGAWSWRLRSDEN